MPIPPFQDLFLPFLQYTADGKVHSTQDVAGCLASHFKLTPEEIAEGLPSGRQTKFHNRVAWAKSFLGKAVVIEHTGRNRFQITQRGRDLLAVGHTRIDNRTLNQYPEFQVFRGQLEDTNGANHNQRPTGNNLPEQGLLLQNEAAAQTPEEQRKPPIKISEGNWRRT